MSDSSIGKIVIIFLTLAAATLLSLSDFGDSNKVKIYDCSIAEWHPDIPVPVKEACRKLKLEEEEYRRNEQYFPKKNLTIT